jgi:hypothetical protein
MIAARYVFRLYCDACNVAHPYVVEPSEEERIRIAPDDMPHAYVHKFRAIIDQVLPFWDFRNGAFLCSACANIPKLKAGAGI